ncbi:type IV secretion system DNA-binding domain-containing protein [Candidatus Falkowbacteria bacterium]|nr:type IV secretion system DNA-binding domain-containing protein [Candidatus Falkowbacteria bacterium]
MIQTFSPNLTITVPLPASALDVGSFFSSPLWFGLLMTAAVVAVLVGVAFIARWFTVRYGRGLPKAFRQRILLITLPKESIKQEKGKERETQQSIVEEIGLGEMLVASIGGLKAEKGLMAWFFGRADHLALEIVADHESRVSFYAAVPHYLCQYFEQQVNAHYPDAFIEAVEDYNIFSPQGFVKGAYLQFKRQSFFPIKTYKKMENDPIEALTNVLSKLEEHEGAVIQYVIRSARPKWHKIGAKVVSEMKQGKKLREAVHEATAGVLRRSLKLLGSVFTANKKHPDGSPIGQQHYQLSQMEDEMGKGIEEKSSKAGLDVNIRVIVCTDREDKSQLYLDNIINAFSQYNIYEYGNSFSKVSLRHTDRLVSDFIHRNFSQRYAMILNSEELASLYHLPLTSTDTPNIRWLSAKKAPAPLTLPREGLRLGVNRYRGKETVIRIKRDDRRRHMYIIGKSGVGKSTMMSAMAAQDIANGEGVCVIDPHGDLVDDILTAVPKERADDVILFDPADIERPMGLNLLEYDPRYAEQKTFVINEMIKIFDKLYDLRSTGGPMFEQYMRNAMLLIMDDPASGSTLMEISKVLADAEYRRYKLSKCTTTVVKDFWTKEAEKAGGEASLQNMVPYITSKLNTFISNDFMRPIIGQQTSAINFRDAMDSGKILLVRLSKGRLGDINTNLLGMVIVGKILMAALSRTDSPKDQRRDFYLYIDEFQNFTTDSIAVILSEARKYMLDLVIAHQYVGQLVKNNDTTIRDAVFGNVGTIACFKIGVEDAEIFAKEFAPVFNEYDVINIEKYTAYVKLLVDNEATKAFNMATDNFVPQNRELAAKIRELSRLKYGQDRQIVEREILDRVNTLDFATVSPASGAPGSLGAGGS